MKTFYFDTGVIYANYPSLFGNQVVRGGTKQIPFDADVPEDAQLMFLCDHPDLRESKAPNVMVVPVFNTDMVSKYAYFRVRVKEEQPWVSTAEYLTTTSFALLGGGTR